MNFAGHAARTTIGRKVSDSELDAICGGTSNFVASLVATVLNVVYNAGCTAAKGHVVCQNPIPSGR